MMRLMPTVAPADQAFPVPTVKCQWTTLPKIQQHLPQVHLLICVLPPPAKMKVCVLKLVSVTTCASARAGTTAGGVRITCRHSPPASTVPLVSTEMNAQYFVERRTHVPAISFVMPLQAPRYVGQDGVVPGVTSGQFLMYLIPIVQSPELDVLMEALVSISPAAVCPHTRVSCVRPRCYHVAGHLVGSTEYVLMAHKVTPVTVCQATQANTVRCQSHQLMPVELQT